jgi:ribosomal protein S18 acetylase RimI-like enzyme
MAFHEPPRQVSKATSADFPRLVEIRAAVRENILSDPGSVTTADIQWFIDNSTIWTWVEDGQICGFSAGDPRDGTIFALFVDPCREGRGIGQALISLACATLRQAGHTTVTLGTEPGTRAERFYRRNGWISFGHKSNGEILFRLDI